MTDAELIDILREVTEVRLRFGHLPLYRLEAEWASSGIWLPKTIGSIGLGPCLRIENFEISDRVRHRLAAWHELFENEKPECQWTAPGSYARFASEGVNVAIDISVELGGGALVEYELMNNGLLFCDGQCVAVYRMDPTTSGLWRGRLESQD